MESDATEEQPGSAPIVVSASELRECNFEGPLADVIHTKAYELSFAYCKAAAGAEEGSPQRRAWALMDALCGMGLQPDDKADVWKPLFSTGNRRSSLPEDFRGEQAEALLEIVEEIKHPALRARVADIIWSGDRRKGKAAQIAVESYCDCGEQLLSGEMTGFSEEAGPDLFNAVDVAHRALQIAYATSKRGQMPERPKDLIRAVFEASKTHDGYVALTRAGEIALHFGALESEKLARDAEALAASATEDTYAMAVHGTYMFAARQYDRLKDSKGRQRSLKGALAQTLEMRKGVSGAAAEAHWVSDALQELRHIDGMEELEHQLEIDLKRLQKASLKEMGTFTYPIDVKEETDVITAFFDQCTLSDGLREMALLDNSRDPDKLRRDALEGLKRSPLSSMFSAVHLDQEGRTTAVSAGASLGEEPDETWFNHTINQSEHFHRTLSVAGRLHPARLLLNARFGITERHLHDIVEHSPFVPASQVHLYALGLTRFFQGDFMSSTHLLLPQLETCLRYVLKQRGLDPSKRRDDGTEEDLSLSGLFDRMRTELDDVLGADLASEVDRLFNCRPGPALRHELAHGQISTGACFSEDVYYANWLMYRIAVLPLISHWDKLIEPALEQG